MIDQDEAQSRVLAFGQAETGVAFAIQTCERSPRGDYWIIRANSEEFVLGGDRTQGRRVGFMPTTLTVGVAMVGMKPTLRRTGVLTVGCGGL